jgi:hypothetical protein
MVLANFYTRLPPPLYLNEMLQPQTVPLPLVTLPGAPCRRRFDTPRPPASSSGTAAVRFSSFGPAHNVTGTYWGAATGAWLGLRCALVPNASAEEKMTWCLWSPATDRSTPQPPPLSPPRHPDRGPGGPGRTRT